MDPRNRCIELYPTAAHLHRQTYFHFRQANLDIRASLWDKSTKTAPEGLEDYLKDEQNSVFNLMLRRIQSWTDQRKRKLQGDLVTDFGTGVVEWAQKQAYRAPTAAINLPDRSAHMLYSHHNS